MGLSGYSAWAGFENAAIQIPKTNQIQKRTVNLTLFVCSARQRRLGGGRHFITRGIERLRDGSVTFIDIDADQASSGGIHHWFMADQKPRRRPMMRPRLVATALFISCLLAGHGVYAADGCGAGLHRDPNGRCQFYRAARPADHACSVGYIWRNGHCRHNVGNDPFVSTWPNAPR
jgi:hypothetical protein